MLSLPNMTAPASKSWLVIVLSYSGLNPSRMREAACDGTPLVQNRSLIPSGMPHISGASPALMRVSAAAACAVAISGVWCTKAPSASAPSIAVRQAAVISALVVSPLRSASRACAMVSLVRSDIILPPSAQQKILHGRQARSSTLPLAGCRPSPHPRGASGAGG